jgi:hypothetical protein
MGKGQDSMVGRVPARSVLQKTETHGAQSALVVRMHRDDETGGWWADSDDIPGLTSEAPTYDSLRARVSMVVPALCQANGIDLVDRAVSFEPKLGDQTMERQELDSALSELGSRIWEAIQNDDAVVDLIFELANKKLSLDKVKSEDSYLDDDAAKVILGDVDDDPENLVRPKQFVPPREWAKYALYNLALDWVVDQALARMKLAQKWPFQKEDGFPKP